MLPCHVWLVMRLFSLPLQTVIVGSYLIAHGFFSVYGMCVDTLFLCFCKYFGLCGSLLKHKRGGCGKRGPISLQSNTFFLSTA